MQLIDGKQTAALIKEEIAQEVKQIRENGGSNRLTIQRPQID